ncbi:MAG: 4-hydroxythreonine-4-phosphate dehydrogenase PdxA [Deltaproteobacteria bacterium]
MKPRIGITMGDPNGIGAEIIAKALCCSELQELAEFIVFGNEEIIKAAAILVGMRGEFKIAETGDFGIGDLRPGIAEKSAGRASLGYIEGAVKSAMEGKLDAIVTAPIAKEATHLAGSKFPGHTEMLQSLTGAKDARMMFDGGAFRVALQTIHTALAEVPALINEAEILRTIEIVNDALISQFGIVNPKIVVCGLNPHAGEVGAFGREEIVHIIPAIQSARRGGIDVSGPLPADTLFYYAAKGRWDMVIAMYHDQGLVPFKMLSFDDGVNVTLGLPIIRTSPDHGTAYDIAWRGEANPSSMAAAVKLAVRLARSKTASRV